MSSSGKKSKTKWKPVTLDTVINTSVKRSTSSWAEEVECELYSGTRSQGEKIIWDSPSPVEAGHLNAKKDGPDERASVSFIRLDYTAKKLSNIVLPTAPRAACELVIDDSKIPQNGPFVAYLSNLPYEITEEDISSQFNELKIVNVQLPKDDRQDRMKGFGYIEFKDKSNLLAALNEGCLSLKGRSVRISLPDDEEQNKDRGSRSGGMPFSRNRDMSDRNDRSERPLGEWRVGASVPHDPDKPVSRQSGVGFTRSQNRDRDGDRGSGPFRDFSRGGGGGFQSDSGGLQFSRAFGSRDRDRDDREGGRSSDRDRDRDRGGGRSFTSKRYERDDRMGSGGRSAFGKKFDRDDREIKRESMPVDREEPKQRPKLDIQQRSLPIDEDRTPAALPFSIFGGAKPVNTAKREREIEAKLQTLTTVTRSRGATPPPRSTPASNLSRSSSVSSLSSARRNETDSAETTNESNQSSEQPEHDADSSGGAPDSESTAKPAPPEEFKQPENVWKQRSAALSSAAPPAENSSSTVIENVEAVADASDSVTSNDTSKSAEPAVAASESADDSTSSRRDEKSTWSDARAPINNRDRTSYSRDAQDEPFGGRYIGSGNRSNDKFSSFGGGRENRRRDNRDHDDRRSDNRNYRNSGDDYGGGSRHDSQSKWSRDTFNRNKNSDFGNSRRHERDVGGGNYASFRGGDRNDNRDGRFSGRSFRSSNSNLRGEDGESAGGEYRQRQPQRYEQQPPQPQHQHNEDGESCEERLVDSETSVANGAAIPATESAIDDSRLQGDIGDDAKPLENGNENGVDGDGGEITPLTENVANSAELSEDDFSFKTRKKHSRKKRNQERSANDVNEDAAKPIEMEGKAKNLKEEKKNADNHQNNEKTSSKNNTKAKESRPEKPPKKPREPRDGISGMPKQKEEKTPNFQDENPFQILDDN